MTPSEQFQVLQHSVIVGISEITRGMRDLANALSRGQMTLDEAASTLRYVADAMAHELREMSQ